jgi:4-hydroxy-tetrahydrodipicolinate synthase
MNNPEGIITPLVSPLLSENRLDVEGLEAVVEHVLAGGVHGIFVLGTTGEGPSLSYDLRGELTERVCDQVAGRVPVLVGITDSSFGQAVEMAGRASDAGAEAVVLAPPFYYQIREGELHDFVDRLIREIELPLFLYNNPALTGVTFDLDTVRALIRRPEVIGVKDSSGSGTYFHDLRRVLHEEDLPLFVGPEELLAESLIMGADGGVPGGSNVFPELYVDVYDSVQAGNLSRALERHEQILDLSSIVYSGEGSSAVINGIKSALSALGLCSDVLAPPLKPASAEKAEKITEFVSTAQKTADA